MNKIITTAAFGTLLTVGTASAATLFTGAVGGDINVAGNWNSSLPSNSNLGTLGTTAVWSDSTLSDFDFEVTGGATLTRATNFIPNFQGDTDIHIIDGTIDIEAGADLKRTVGNVRIKRFRRFYVSMVTAPSEPENITTEHPPSTEALRTAARSSSVACTPCVKGGIINHGSMILKNRETIQALIKSYPKTSSIILAALPLSTNRSDVSVRN